MMNFGRWLRRWVCGCRGGCRRHSFLQIQFCRCFSHGIHFSCVLVMDTPKTHSTDAFTPYPRTTRSSQKAHPPSRTAARTRIPRAPLRYPRASPAGEKTLPEKQNFIIYLSSPRFPIKHPSIRLLSIVSVPSLLLHVCGVDK